MLYQGTELAYAAPQTNLALSINANNIKNGHKREESPTALYMEALRNAQMKQAAKDERLFEQMPTLTLSEFVNRVDQIKDQKLTEALEKYEHLTGLFNKIASCADYQVSEETGECKELQNYFQFFATNRVIEAIQIMVQAALKDYYNLIKGLTISTDQNSGDEIKGIKKFLKDTFTPLFNIQLHIQGKQI